MKIMIVSNVLAEVLLFGMPGGSEWLFIIALLIVVWILLRELICWYYKINESISHQKKTNELLEILINKIDGKEAQKEDTIK